MKDLKVVEFATVLAGPSVGMFFSELGARVIKIENKNVGGDITRKWKLPVENPTYQTSAYFASVNYLKEHIFLDLRNEDDLSIAKSYLLDADIVICNWKKGDGEKYQLDYASIKKYNSKIIYGVISGYKSIPEKVAYDIVLQAETGWISMTGADSEHLCKVPIAVIDLFAAHQLKEGILYALYQREKYGKGALVSVNLFDAAVASLANQASNYLMTKTIPQPIGTLHPNIAPYGEIFETLDHEKIVLAIGTDPQFVSICKLLQEDHLCNDEKFISNRNRVNHRIELKQIFAQKIIRLPSEDFLQSCLQLQIPCGLIRTLDALFELPDAKSLILKDQNGMRVKTVIFNIE